MMHAKEALASCKCQLKVADQRPKSGPKPLSLIEAACG